MTGSAGYGDATSFGDGGFSGFGVVPTDEMLGVVGQAVGQVIGVLS